MAKAKRKPTKAPVRRPEITEMDATPERIAKGESDIVVALIGKAGERQGKARRFRAAHLDRWHKAGMITQRQWAAGEHYRATHERCHFRLSVIASYGERIHAACNPGDFGYGLPRLDAHAAARSEMRSMRQMMPKDLQGTMDSFLLHDRMPRYGGNQYARYLTKVRTGLDALAAYLW